MALSHFPVDVLSGILSLWCDGKSISTFLIVAKGNRDLRDSHFALIRDALVRRYVELAEELRNFEEINDVLDAIREDVRNSDPRDGSFKFPEWCAILDYFDGQTKENSEWVVWCGPVETQFGTVQARVSTREWTPSALQYWHGELELVHFALVPPRRDAAIEMMEPYGRLDGMREDDDEILKRLRHTLSGDSVSGRRALVPSHMEYDPTLMFTLPPQQFDQGEERSGPAFICYWEEDDGYGWEESIDKLGENVIRIMNRYFACGRTFK